MTDAVCARPRYWQAARARATATRCHHKLLLALRKVSCSTESLPSALQDELCRPEPVPNADGTYPPKPCSLCNVTKELEDFGLKRGSKDGRDCYCRICSTLRRRYTIPVWYCTGRRVQFRVIIQRAQRHHARIRDEQQSLPTVVVLLQNSMEVDVLPCAHRALPHIMHAA